MDRSKSLLGVVLLDMMEILRRNQCWKGGCVWNVVAVGVASEGGGNDVLPQA